MAYSFNYQITDSILTSISQIERLRAQIDGSHILPEREIELRHRATVEATHSSTAIEGNPLTIKQVEKILADGNVLSRHQYAALEVRNYKKALSFVDKRKRTGQAIALADILTIHAIIMQGLLPPEKTGALRTGGVWVVDQNDVEQYAGPNESIIESELAHLLAWLKPTAVHPVVAAALLHLQFVSIHPFSDGNGRTTRVLVQLYLGLHDYDLRGAIVLDSYYLADKLAYYQALDVAADYHGRMTADISSWLGYFVAGFLSSVKVLAIEVTVLFSVVGAGVSTKTAKLGRDDADLLGYARQFNEIRLSDAESILPNLSPRTLQRKLRRLTAAGYLVSSGKARSTTYRWRRTEPSQD